MYTGIGRQMMISLADGLLDYEYCKDGTKKLEKAPSCRVKTIDRHAQRLCQCAHKQKCCKGVRV